MTSVTPEPEVDVANIQLRLDQAKINLMRVKNTVFFSSLLSMMDIQASDRNDTAWTDGVSMGLSPKFVAKLDTDELIWVLMHELGHIIYEHIPIAMENNLDMSRHNIAGDHYINLWLQEIGYKEPQCIKPYRDKKYKGWGSMKIYHDIEENEDPKNGGMGKDIVLPDAASAAAHKEKMTDNMIKATIQADMMGEPGSVPGNVRRFVDEATSSNIDWQEILQNHLSQYARDDYSMRRPNRRYLPDWIMPSLFSEKLGHFIFATDTSASMWDELLADINAEGRYMWETLQPQTMRHISFDTKIHENTVYEQGDYLHDLTLSGGGGTCVEDVLQYVINEEPQVTIIATDGYFSMPEELPGDIYWLIFGNESFTAPRGTVIHLPARRT
jgi:predicted metal-dependent peptidase